MSATLSSTAAMASATGPAAQGGILEGLNPILVSKTAPINLFIIQAVIIIIFCRLLHFPLSLLGQPRVIAEVLGGIILGPSVMMRIPGFKENIFPTEAMPVLNNVANLGLILFLFLVGLEVDTRMFRSNWRVALSVGFAGMTIPFGLGVAVAYGLYHEYGHDDGMAPISFGVFALFIGTALAITAFPVLCRILSELQLLQTPVGVTVLAAGIGNDVTGWVLLALSVALVNNASGLTALYVFLTAVAWVLFLVFAVRPAFYWVLRKNGSLQNGPSPAIISLTLLIVLVSSWFTAAIGVHAIFGAFLAGLICPHEGGFAIKLTEKIEDLVAALLVPLYFALSGLSTNLGLLDDGKTWGYVVAITVIAFVGKISGGMLAARGCRLLWRESITIGVLMSCKGLVELIVLNIGLQARILSEKTFTMFVIMALVTTVATTPLAKAFYPMSYRKKVEKWKNGEIDWEGNPLVSEAQATNERLQNTFNKFQTSRLLVNLRLDNLNSLFGLIAVLGDARSSAITKEALDNKEGSRSGEKPSGANIRPLEVRGLRLLELTDRTSSVMQSAELDGFAGQDPVFAAFQSFSQLHGIAVAGHLNAVAPQHYATTLVEHAQETGSDLILLPWSAHGSLTEDRTLATVQEVTNEMDRFLNRQHIDFVQNTLDEASCSTAVFISRGDVQHKKQTPTLRTMPTGLSVHSVTQIVSPLSQPDKTRQRFFVPYIGGNDDQLALRFVLQLAQSSGVDVTVAHVTFSHEETITMKGDVEGDRGEWASELPTASDLEFISSSRRTVASGVLSERVKFVDLEVDSLASVPSEVLRLAKANIRPMRGSLEDMIVTGRRHGSLNGLLTGEIGLDSDFQTTVGVLGDAFIRDHVDAGLLVMQAKKSE